jgi:selenocysteine-specific elongation factor
MGAAPLTLGTAGHIDHGKTALIRALTGVDTDRLPEERARGISIELGYASLELPSGRRVSVIDAPGHERFVRTMVAGATGIDLYLMTVAADDGVMPQTREHATVLRALDVRTGVIAVTKSDLADPDVALIEASELLPGAEAVAVSARTGHGLERLREALDRAAASLHSRAGNPGPARLHIDRAFTIRGAGTVVTGTLWSGSIARGDEVLLLPEQRRARVRGVQVHDEPVESAAAGQRVALNLTGIAVSEVARGDVLASADTELRPTYLLDARLEPPGDEPEPGTRVQVHHGTRETAARMAWLGGDFWQLRLEQPLIASAGDRVVVRQIAPPDTLGGGVVLDARPHKHGPSRDVLARLERLNRGEPDPVERVPEPHGSGGTAVARDSRKHVPRIGLQPDPKPLSQSALATERRLIQAGAEPPLDSELDPDDLAALREHGRAIRVSKNLHYHPDALSEIRQGVVALAQRNGGTVTLASLRDELHTSRKFAQALLEHFDSERLTIRRGDEHVLRRSSQAL